MNRRDALAALLAALAVPTVAAARTEPAAKIGYRTLAPLGERSAGERTFGGLAPDRLRADREIE